jgi:phosphoenolpyruvate carboxykinase (GTP)
MHVKNGQLYAVNPENGFFGVAPGTNAQTNPNAIKALSENSIFTNVGLTPDGDPWWKDITAGEKTPPAGTLDWHGEVWPGGDGDVAHANSRFTAPASQCPSISDRWQDPEGVPISVIMFGGRRTRVAPLVYQARDWEHGVFVGASMASETTAAAAGKVGMIRRDPMAMLPFCGYNMGDYFGHWLAMGQKLDKPPAIFHVNWFRKDAQGEFLWPGFGQNVRVLRWMLERVRGTAEARETPIGFVPTPGALDLDGLDLTPDAVNQLLSVDPADWTKDYQHLGEFLKPFGSHLPAGIQRQYDALGQRLGRA